MRTLLLPLLFGVAIVGAAGSVAAGNVAVIMAAQVDEYDKALRGFNQTARHQVVAQYNMNGSMAQGQKALDEIRAKVKPDLILAIGVWALEVVASHATHVPVVYAMVLNPPSVVQAGTRNITGASMNVPVDQQIRLFKQLGPHIRRVGVLYNATKTGYLVQNAEVVAREHGLQLISREVQSPKDALPALDAIQNSIDALWILPDETILAPAVVQQMLLVSYRRKLPLLGLSEGQAKMGALLSLSFASGEDIGRQAGDLANSILAGKTAAEVPYTTARQVKLTVNLKAAHKLGLEIPKSILDRASTVLE